MRTYVQCSNKMASFIKSGNGMYVLKMSFILLTLWYLTLMHQLTSYYESINTCLYRRIPQLCPAFGQNGRGLMRRIVIFTCDDHYRLANATWAHVLWQFDGQNSRKTTKQGIIILYVTCYERRDHWG